MLFMVDACADLKPVIGLLKAVLMIIQFGIPMILIIMGSIDLGKAVLASDDKEIKGATSKLIKRAIAAVAVFFVPLIVNLLINMVGQQSAQVDKNGNLVGKTTFWTCWSATQSGVTNK